MKTYVCLVGLITPPRRRVLVQRPNDAQLPSHLLAEAKAAVAAIYAKAGIDVTFVDARADFTIVLLSRHTTHKMRQIPDAVGFAPGSETTLVRIAYVLQPRVDKIAAGYWAPRAMSWRWGLPTNWATS